MVLEKMFLIQSFFSTEVFDTILTHLCRPVHKWDMIEYCLLNIKQYSRTIVLECLRKII